MTTLLRPIPDRGLRDETALSRRASMDRLLCFICGNALGWWRCSNDFLNLSNGVTQGSPFEIRRDNGGTLLLVLVDLRPT